MNTLIESVNAISTIKKELNEVLRENGIEGGEVFSDYPEKFRQLFRVTEDITSSISDGYKIDYDNVITNILPPSLSVYENVVTVTNNTEGSSLYYYIRTESGKNNVGITALTKGNTIIVSETSTVFVYCVYRGEKSDEASKYVIWNVEVVPDPPTITREGTTVTITKDSEEDVVYYSIDSSPYTLYEGPVTVERYESISAFSQNYRGRSAVVTDEAPEQPIKPEKPVLVCSANVLTITCSTENATIYYTKKGGYFSEYTGPVTITSSNYGLYEAKSYKDGLFSEEPNPELYCNYIATPAAPGFNQVGNTVYIYSSSSEASILYKIDDGSYQLYTTPITLTSGTITISAKTSYQGLESDEVSQSFTYVEPVTPTAPADPTLSFNDNVITIECYTVGAVIKYRTSLAELFIDYTGPIEIYSDTTIYTYSTKDGLDSNIVSDSFIYTPPITPEVPAVPIFSCNNNIVTITCSTLNAEIWYRDINSIQWIKYTTPFEINQTTQYIAFSTKNGVDSSDSEIFTATYNPSIIVPDDPVITCVNNVVTISCTTEGATLRYRWTSPVITSFIQVPSSTVSFTINSDITVEAYSELNGIGSLNRVSKECQYQTIVPINEYDPEPSDIYYTTPLTISMIESGSLLYTANTPKTITGTVEFEYSLDGINWVKVRVEDMTIKYNDSGAKSYSYEINLNSNSVINLRCTSGSTTGIGMLGTDDTGKIVTFKINGKCNVSGNLLSLVFNNGDYEERSYHLLDAGMNSLFKGSDIVDASNLIIPKYIGANNCYRAMFSDCTQLLYPPKIKHVSTTFNRSTEDFTNTFYAMFSGCIKMEANSKLPTFYNSRWVHPMDFMFKNCTSLRSKVNITIGANYDRFMGGKLGWNVFDGCNLLKNITINCSLNNSQQRAYVNNYLSNIFYNLGGSGTVYCTESLNKSSLGLSSNWAIQDV